MHPHQGLAWSAALAHVQGLGLPMQLLLEHMWRDDWMDGWMDERTDRWTFAAVGLANNVSSVSLGERHSSTAVH